MADPLTIASLVLGGVRFAWDVGRSMRRSSSRSQSSRSQSSRSQGHRSDTRQQITRAYSSPQLYLPSRPTQQYSAGPQITVFSAQRSADTYEDQDTGIQMGTGFRRGLLMPPAVHWRNPMERGGPGTVLVVDWTNRMAWVYVHVQGAFHLWYKVDNVDTNHVLQLVARRYAAATITLQDGCPIWSSVALEVVDGSPEYNGGFQSTNDWISLGIPHSHLEPGDRLFVGMTRALLMGLLVGRYAMPTGLNVDTVLDDEGYTYINIDSGVRSNPVRRGPAHLTVFRCNTDGWADEFVWVG